MLKEVTAITLLVASHAVLAADRRAELVPFRDAGDGVVIDVGKPRVVAAVPAETSEALPIEALAADFHNIALPQYVDATAPVSRSAIPVPLWMQTGRALPGGLSPALAPLTSYLYSSSACALTTYRPRGDLPTWLEARRAQYFPLISAVACEAGVPTGLLDALVAQESQYNPGIVSPKGAVGLTQLMPGTARGLGVLDSRDPIANLRGGARYLRTHLDEFKRVDLALAAYNAGPGRVRTLRRIPQIRETIDYVSAITRGWSSAAFRTASIQTVDTPKPVVAGRGVELLAYTSTSVPNPRW
ncbi:soluble lytic murein transglycosylase-like protein [Sphingomonas sp. BE138]|uniref:lytic transglycosylase domain-containing protein n=1 Tax=Sphingomonas sp. BE138 TaxID=2817845 RepID=UPI0028615248|nr:lytic transglycosylase domain-containing protein [Sphingomonas sp. BE138]MDR6790804.1 soluble lytic murein transglycosylase-like protein [Sphingomonas sp. BE138]